ncbi:C39 family peptidase [Archangium lipolyticum]|uniref:C39 family peptidase n=1 Tax=Archangium lipolyticum TaxID=2970465 RepID=UPI00214A7546|nr:C39 family peptidase [Archangium lipolyticum]
MSTISRSSLSNVHGGLARALGSKIDAPKQKNELGQLEQMLAKLAEALGGKNGAGDAQGKYKAGKEDTLELLAKLLKMLGFPGSEEEILNQLKSLNPQSKDGKLQAGQQVRLPSPGGVNGDSTFTPASTRSGPSLGGPSSVGPGSPLSGASGASGAAPVSDGQHVVGRDVPYINQLSPTGADGSYTNGAMNCGPASMAMLAREMGYGAGMTDAQLINHLGQIGGTNSSEGTNVNGIVAMANAMGKNAQINQGTNVSWMADQLRQGKQVVALGDFHAMPPHQDEGRTSGHFVTVTGMDANGNFLVRDPADPNVRAVSPEQMAHFLGSHPAGGHQVAIG